MAKKFFWLTASFILALTSCGGEPGEGGGNPAIRIGDDRISIVWDEMENAVSYEVIEDGDKHLSTKATYELSTAVGKHSLTVKGVDKDGNRIGGSSFNYTSKESQLSELTVTDNKITWSSADSYGLEYRINNGDFKPVTGSYIDTTEKGLYMVRAPKKINDEKVFYCTEITRLALVSDESVEQYILEDAEYEDDASLSENYRKYKYVNNGWETAGVDVKLDKSSKAFVDDNAAMYGFKYWGSYFMFEKDVTIPCAFNELSFDVKSTEDVNFFISFQIKYPLIIGNFNLTGVYITYPVAASPTEWTHYRVSLDDTAWQVDYGGTKMSFATAKQYIAMAGLQVNSLAEFLPYFDVYQIRVRGASKSGGPDGRIYFDDIQLVKSDLQTTKIEKIIPKFAFAQSYAFKSNAFEGTLNIGDEISTFSVPAMSLSLHVSHEIVNNQGVITCVESGKDFIATFSSPDGGASLVLENVQGTLAPYFEGIIVEAVNKLDDFEQYLDTGTGYDKAWVQAHPDETYTPDPRYIRGAYYSDWFNNGGPQSEIGDSQWSLMGSTDYLYLAKQNYHTGGKAMNIKAGSNACRFTTFGLKDGVIQGYKGKYFSFWMKSDTTQDMGLNVALYFVPQVTPSNHASDAARTKTYVEVSTNCDWHEVKIPLDPNKTYYGFSFTTEKGPSTAKRIYIDDIYIYGDLSPWGTNA